ncbi:MAG: aminotransferase class I/II-fold pyridoxal phosphate-dependent enzyme, partial [Opitutaceae bacterium]
MRTVLVTGSDTGIGKTRVAGAIARLLAAGGCRVQVVKIVETGVSPGAAGDAAAAAEAGVRALAETGPAKPSADFGPAASTLSGPWVRAFTLFSYPAPLAPAAASAKAGAPLRWDEVLAAVRRLPGEADWRVYEGAGGIASPLAGGRDWSDFARAAGVDHTVLVVADRLGAINQARLVFAHAAGLDAGLWLNAAAEVGRDVAASTREALRSAGLPIWAEHAFGADLPLFGPPWLARPERTEAGRPRAGSSRASGRSTGASKPLHPGSARAAGSSLASGSPAGREGPVRPSGVPEPAIMRAPGLAAGAGDPLSVRWKRELDEREAQGLLRRVRLAPLEKEGDGRLNLADNDYLDLARDPAVVSGAADAARRWGASACASPLVTGWKEPHERLIRALCVWHGFSHGLLWTSGYAANGAVLSTLPAAGDLVLADRLVHHSMIAGLLRSGARFQRYPHLD